jgi:hypothetical protein
VQGFADFFIKDIAMNHDSIKPNAILDDAENFLDLNGLAVRKGSTADFLKNIHFFDNSNSKKPKSQCSRHDKIINPGNS